MGACQFINRGRGTSAKDAFNRLQYVATSEYGHDSYNGTISTVPGFNDITNEYKSNNRGLSEFIDYKLDSAHKYDCFCICVQPPVENKNKTKTQVEHIIEKGTKKWVLKYCVYDNWEANLIGSFNTKGDAVKKAREYTEKTQKPTHIAMEKKLDKGTSTVAKITYKKSSNERDGEYVFFGYAAE